MISELKPAHTRLKDQGWVEYPVSDPIMGEREGGVSVLAKTILTKFCMGKRFFGTCMGPHHVGLYFRQVGLYFRQIVLSGRRIFLIRREPGAEEGRGASRRVPHLDSRD